MPKPINKRERDRDHDRRRREQKPWRALYSTARWKACRADQLQRQPLCERCMSRGIVTPATVAHHTIRHNGDEELFFNGPLASSCSDCHDIDEQRIEHGGRPRQAVDADGWPI